MLHCLLELGGGLADPLLVHHLLGSADGAGPHRAPAHGIGDQAHRGIDPAADLGGAVEQRPRGVITTEPEGGAGDPPRRPAPVPLRRDRHRHPGRVQQPVGLAREEDLAVRPLVAGPDDDEACVELGRPVEQGLGNGTPRAPAGLADDVRVLCEHVTGSGCRPLTFLLRPQLEVAIGVTGDGRRPGLRHHRDGVHRVVVGPGELARELHCPGVVLVRAERQQDGHWSSLPRGSAISSGSTYVFSVALRRPYAR